MSAFFHVADALDHSGHLSEPRIRVFEHTHAADLAADIEAFRATEGVRVCAISAAAVCAASWSGERPRELVATFAVTVIYQERPGLPV